ncbi:phenylacetate--CoA ligase family protein [Marinobacter profundi]|uniref:CoF synthetase n=1 Tax=Marinobacter profundi TaxID=2666256 RepID=UPI0014747405|nr:CoF synthetase [Marinobacter profundi]
MNEVSRNEILNQELIAKANHDNSTNIILRLEDIRSAPVMGKEIFSKRDLSSRGSLRKGFSRHTSGTTGKPTFITLSSNELERMLAVREYCFNHHGISLGHREARIWGRGNADIKGKLKNFLLNRKLFTPEGENSHQVVKRLIAWCPDYVYGYSSLVIEASKALSELKLSPKGIKCVICTAENITPFQKAMVSEAFNCPVIEEYGSTEFDVIAFDCRMGHRHLVNPWLVVEESDDGCLVTDISRASQGLVRYKLGDIIKLQSENCGTFGSKSVITGIEGRSANQFVFSKNGERFHSVEFAYIFDRYLRERNEYFNFQVIQEKAGKVLITTDPSPKLGTEDLCSYLKKALYDKVNLDIDAEYIFDLDENIVAKKKSYFIQRLAQKND